ncbi:MAG: hypothetical protein JJD92_10765 [Frankiaceae bacterium]|nr:hypothetical protein [Frankiaceae bacterium]
MKPTRPDDATFMDDLAGTATDDDWIDAELAVELEVDDELAFEVDDFPMRLIEGDDDRFASAFRDPGSYAAEELAMHLVG